MKKFLSFLMVAALAVSMMIPFPIAASAAVTGMTGKCTWSLDGTILTISGNGVMMDYTTSNQAPWGTSLTEVIIEEGVTKVGNYAFENCRNLTKVTIAESVTKIGNYAFSWCTKLPVITIPDGVVSIGNNAFYNCNTLASITIPESVTEIGENAFAVCSCLTSVTIPHTVSTVGSAAFNTQLNDENEDATLYVHEGTFGYTYALENANPYIVTGHTFEMGACTVCGKTNSTTGSSGLTTAHAILLLRYIDRRDVELDFDPDVNDDGKVSVFDAVRFLQLLNQAV